MNRIKSMKELEAAQSRVRRDLAIKKNSMARRFDDAKEFYTPANLVSNAIGNITPMFDVRGLLLGIIRDIRNKL
ncbi:MAG: hypothetical protein MJY88_01260 [Bacteroidales bacterium]|nr:hypothetical protein [Bacteroidales bacterium]